MLRKCVTGDWYLIAYDEFRQGIHNFAVGRIEEWIVRSEAFKRDPKFSVAKYMESGFQAEHGGEVVEVVIRFAPQAARYIREKRWHESQQIQEQEGGGLVLKFQTSGLGEVKRWVLQYGGNLSLALRSWEASKGIEFTIRREENLHHIQTGPDIFRAVGSHGCEPHIGYPRCPGLRMNSEL